MSSCPDAYRGDAARRAPSEIYPFRFFIVLTLIVLAACSGSDKPAVQAADPPADFVNSTPQSALPLDEQGRQLVARVNGEAITLAEFDQAFDRLRGQSTMANYSDIAANVMDMLIEQQLINQAAARMNITASDEEVNTQIQEYRSMVENDAAWQEWLRVNNFTEEELRESVRADLITKRLIESVTTAEAGMQIAEVNARHILVDTPDEANAIIARLNNGEDFATLAAQLSKDVTTRDQGGDLGWFTRDGLLTPELAEIAFQLQPNQIGGPVRTMLGYHVIQTLASHQREAQADEQSALIAQQFTNWLQVLLEDAVIERYIQY